MNKPSLIKRILAGFIDFIVFVIIFSLADSIFGLKDLMDKGGLLSWIALIMYFAYYVLIQYFFKKTLGYYFFNLKLVNKSNNKLFLRILAREFYFFFCYLGGIGIVLFIFKGAYWDEYSGVYLTK